MPFSIFCIGNDNFHFGHSRVPVLGDVYDIQTAMGRLSTAGTEGVATAVRGAVQDAAADPKAPADNAVERTMRRFDGISGLYTFRQGVDLARTAMTALRIALDVRHAGIVMTESRFAAVYLDHFDYDWPGHILNAITPALTHAELNCAGVLGTLGEALSEFSAWPCSRFANDAPAPYLLNISLARL